MGAEDWTPRSVYCVLMCSFTYLPCFKPPLFIKQQRAPDTSCVNRRSITWKGARRPAAAAAAACKQTLLSCCATGWRKVLSRRHRELAFTRLRRARDGLLYFTDCVRRGTVCDCVLAVKLQGTCATYSVFLKQLFDVRAVMALCCSFFAEQLNRLFSPSHFKLNSFVLSSAAYLEYTTALQPINKQVQSDLSVQPTLTGLSLNSVLFFCFYIF